MSLQVGGARRNSPSVRHIAKCQNPHCGNPNLTRLVDYVKCNVCGWDTRMNAQDVLDKWGSVLPGSEEPVAPVASTATEDILSDMDAALPSAEDLDAVASEQKVAEDTAPEPRRGKKQRG